MSSEQEIIKVLTPFMLAFPQSKMNAQSLIVYAKALKPLSLEQIEAAMMKLLRNMKFFPSVSEIYFQAQDITDFANGNTDKTLDEAWGEVVKQLHEAFVYKKPVFSTPDIEKAALSMGWNALCEMPVDGVNTARAQFLKIYQSVLERKKNNKANTDILNSLPEAKVKMLITNTGAKLSLVNGGAK